MPAKPQDLPLLTINTIRTLAMDAVQAANSGHPGTPMALAPVVYCLWQDFLRFDPDDPIWPNRDRFVLSNGHASMLLYSMLHLTGVKAVNPQYERLGELSVTLDDIKRFRQLDSKCPGHPEYRLTSGVETTTGPLGQGVATSVGMAIAGRWQAAHFNREGFDLFDYNVYALCGDGDMMEGITGEAASLAGHLELSNLCWIYDNNKITIEGHTDRAFSDDTATRFIGYGWNVTRVGDANDLEMLRRALHVFKNTTDRPDPHHRGQPHRIRRAQQAGHRRRPRRAAGRGGDPSRPSGSTAGRRTPSSWCPTASASTCGTGSAARARAARGLGGAIRGVRQPPSRAGRPSRPDAATPAARRLGPRSSPVPRGSERHRQPRLVGQGAERDREECPLAHRRRGGPRSLHQDAARLRGGRRPDRPEPRRPEYALRCA